MLVYIYLMDLAGDNCHAFYESIKAETDLSAQLEAVEAILKKHSLYFSLEVYRREIVMNSRTRVRVQITARIFPVSGSEHDKTIVADTNYDAVRRFGYRRATVQRDGNDSDTSLVPELNDESYRHARGFFEFFIHNRPNAIRVHFDQDGCIGRAISDILEEDGTLDQLKESMRGFLYSAHSFYMGEA